MHLISSVCELSPVQSKDVVDCTKHPVGKLEGDGCGLL